MDVHHNWVLSEGGFILTPSREAESDAVNAEYLSEKQEKERERNRKR